MPNGRGSSWVWAGFVVVLQLAVSVKVGSAGEAMPACRPSKESCNLHIQGLAGGEIDAGVAQALPSILSPTPPPRGISIRAVLGHTLPDTLPSLSLPVHRPQQ